MLNGCFHRSLGHSSVFLVGFYASLEIGIGAFEYLMKVILPGGFLFLFFVYGFYEPLNKTRKTPCFQKSVYKREWTCIAFRQQVQKQKVIYLNNLETTFIKSPNSSFLTKSIIISVKVTMSKFLIVSVSRPDTWERSW